MNVVDIMTANPIAISSVASIAQAVEKMRAHDFHHLPVLSRDQHVVGVLTLSNCERVLGVSLRGKLQTSTIATARTIPISRAMTIAPIVIEETASAQHAAALMLEHAIGCLPVMRGETLVGIVTRSDVLTAFINFARKLETPLLG